MHFSLSRKNKLKFVAGVIPISVDPDLAEKWDRCNYVVMS